MRTYIQKINISFSLIFFVLDSMSEAESFKIFLKFRKVSCSDLTFLIVRSQVSTHHGRGMSSGPKFSS